jgi:hypothetical protein
MPALQQVFGIRSRAADDALTPACAAASAAEDAARGVLQQPSDALQQLLALESRQHGSDGGRPASECCLAVCLSVCLNARSASLLPAWGLLCIALHLAWPVGHLAFLLTLPYTLFLTLPLPCS